MSAELFYRIGVSSATLRNLFARGLPLPQQAVYNDHTNRRPQGGGGQGRHGYNNADILWRRLTAEQANIIYELINTAETTGGQGNGTVWFTLLKTTAESSGPYWIDISGIAIMPEWSPTENGHGVAYENVTLRINNVTVENDPSTVG
jgi:hypothetical protein